MAVNEDKHDGSEILQAVAARAGGGTLVIANMASSVAREQWQKYQRAFQKLGIKKIAHFDLAGRENGNYEETARMLGAASLVFFGGAEQLRITSSFGGSAMCKLLRQRHTQGLAIAGTSAGASVLSETMLVAGPSDESTRIGDGLRMAPGLGFIANLIIDQHFSERGRIGRLLGAVAQNARLLGLGIDENTAVIVRGHERFETIGDGAVYVVDGRCIRYTNVSESHPDDVLSVHGVQLHVLGRGNAFDVSKHAAIHP